LQLKLKGGEEEEEEEEEEALSQFPPMICQ
jgi:hypothetical protein